MGGVAIGGGADEDMCGVVGLLGTDRGLRGDLRAMSEAIGHRGPDDEGEWVDPEAGVALAHRRLAILDLTSTGHQPMTSADGRYVLVLNGEIYDHREHRHRLEHSGVQWRGHSDTEVLLGLVARQGLPGALSAVDGMFALALWDRQDRVLLLARDRMGEKPLYYGRVGERFVFASELTAVRQLPGVPREPTRDALADFLRHGFVTSPHSVVEGLRKVPPGTIVRVGPGRDADEPRPYWSLSDAALAGRRHAARGPDHELVTRLEDALSGSIGRRLVADVPVGAFLSGGVDSSTVVALAQEASKTPVRTFTVAVGGNDDESSAAARVARHLGTEHTTLPLPEFHPLDLVNRVTDIYDEPFADPSALPTALLCAAARDHVTVALSGDGADELLGGYNRYRVAHGRVAKLLTLPVTARRGAASALRAVPSRTWDRLGAVGTKSFPGLGTKAGKLADILESPGAWEAYSTLATIWSPDDLMVEPPSMEALLRPPAELGPLEALLWADQTTTLPDDMLVKVDRASMAVALEVRVPFLDRRVVELSWQLPVDSKVRHGQGKWILREILAKRVPRPLWERPKLGFDPPLGEWLRGPLRDWAHDLLAPDRLRRQGLLRPEPITSVLSAHDRGERNHDYQLWTVLMLQNWLSRGEG